MPAFGWHPQRSASCTALRSGGFARGRASTPTRTWSARAIAPPPGAPGATTDSPRPHGCRVRQTSLPRHSSGRSTERPSASLSSTTPFGPARPFRLARVPRPGMTNTDVRPLRNGAGWSCGVDERAAAGTLPGGRKAGKVVDADNDHPVARQTDRAVDEADGTGLAASRRATPDRQSRQARRCIVRQSPRRFRPLPRTPSRGLAAALRGLTHEDLIIIYDQIQTDDEGMVSQPEYTLAKPSNGPNDRDHLSRALAARTERRRPAARQRGVQ